MIRLLRRDDWQLQNSNVIDKLASTLAESPMELYYAATSQSQKLSLAQLAEKFAAAGLPCKVEPEAEDMFWLAFDPRASNILASVTDGMFSFGTFNLYDPDPAWVADVVDQVLTSIGFSADEETDD